MCRARAGHRPHTRCGAQDIPVAIRWHRRRRAAAQSLLSVQSPRSPAGRAGRSGLHDVYNDIYMRNPLEARPQGLDMQEAFVSA
jgi:hypothetical protein